MSDYQRGNIPAFARQLDPTIVQLHAADYRNPAQLRQGGVLLVGAGNSGAEIAIELAARHRVWMSGRHPGHVPFRIDGLLAKLILVRLLFRVIFHRLLTVKTPMGRKARGNGETRSPPLIRQKPKQLAAAGVTRVARTVGVREGRPLLEDG